MKGKRFFCVCVLILCISLLCGCANIEYQRITDDTGQILDKLIIELDESDILKKMSATKLTELKNDIKSDLEEYVQIINYKKPQLQVMYPDMDISTGIVAKTIPWIYVDGDVCRISVEVLYRDSTYLTALNGAPSSSDESESSSSSEIISNLFISKYMMYSDNVFMNLEDYGGGVSYYDYYSQQYSEFEVKDVGLTQVYGTTDSRLKSNADYKTKIDGINYHLWEVDTENKGYNSMRLAYYYTTAVGTGWYIVALSLTIVLAIVLTIVYIIKRRNDKKYKQKVLLEDQIAIQYEKDE